MRKDFFTLQASHELVKLFDQAARQTGHGRGRVFTDFLTVARCALAGQTMEDEYLETISRGYTRGPQGRRGIDTLKVAFHRMIDAMQQTGQDVLGDLFQGAITYGENGQFFTPDSLCQMMTALSTPIERTSETRSVNDPACGSGRQLLAVAKSQPHWEFTGQDVDHRCVQMTAINLGLNGLRGWAVWQNSLTLECHRVYRIGLNRFGGVIQEISKQDTPFDHQRKVLATPMHASSSHEATRTTESPTEPDDPTALPPTQLDLF